MAEDGWTRDHRHFSRYPDVPGLERDGNCYWLPVPGGEQPWWKAPFDADVAANQHTHDRAYLILGREQSALLTGGVQVKRIHIAPDLDPDIIGGQLLDPVCAWADTYAWRLDLSEETDADEDDPHLAALSPAFLESRGFARVVTESSHTERWRRAPISAASPP